MASIGTNKYLLQLETGKETAKLAKPYGPLGVPRRIGKAVTGLTLFHSLRGIDGDFEDAFLNFPVGNVPV